MRDYITTVFNLIVGLISPNKLVLLALICLGIIIVWQLLSLITSFNSRLAKKCRRISKFLSTKGLSADNYNKFISLVAKMPQEFIRGYKTFEHASFGLPSDYIKRFDSIDVEVNGGMFNHGKSILKSFIYVVGALLFVLSLALMGQEAALTGYGLADAMLLPLLFIIIGKVIYYIFVAIKQQQYKVAVDEFNEMLDIMNDKIENNDSLPGPDVLADIVADEVTGTVTALPQKQVVVETAVQETNEQSENPQAENWEDEISDVELTQPTVEQVMPQEVEEISESIAEEEILQAEEQQDLKKEDIDNQNLESDELSDNSIDWSLADDEQTVEEIQEVEDLGQNKNLSVQTKEAEPDSFTETDLQDMLTENNQTEYFNEANKESVENLEQNTLPKVYKSDTDEVSTQNVIAQNLKDKEEPVEEQKRGRGRPKKVAEGELVITNDKQFEEVLERAEKLMRKSEEALSSSQAKRVEKALKELVDAMTKYKEEK